MPSIQRVHRLVFDGLGIREGRREHQGATQVAHGLAVRPDLEHVAHRLAHRRQLRRNGHLIHRDALPCGGGLVGKDGVNPALQRRRERAERIVGRRRGGHGRRREEARELRSGERWQPHRVVLEQLVHERCGVPEQPGLGIVKVRTRLEQRAHRLHGRLELQRRLEHGARLLHRLEPLALLQEGDGLSRRLERLGGRDERRLHLGGQLGRLVERGHLGLLLW